MEEKNKHRDYNFAPSDKIDLLKSIHNSYLETLRHREQEIFRYLAILGPAIAGFVWLVKESPKEEVLTIGTLSIIFLLLLGAIYSAALGYNYRYLVILLTKLETIMGIRDAVLVGWPKKPGDFKNKHKRLWCIPWCEPPDIINVFWLAFIISLAGVTVYSYKSNLLLAGYCGFWCILTSLSVPVLFGFNIRKICKEELKEWPPSSNSKNK